MSAEELKALSLWKARFTCQPQAFWCRWSRKFNAYQIFDLDRRFVGGVTSDDVCLTLLDMLDRKKQLTNGESYGNDKKIT